MSGERISERGRLALTAMLCVAGCAFAQADQPLQQEQPVVEQPANGEPAPAQTPDLVELVAQLTERLGDEKWVVREGAEQALIAMGPVAFDAIERMLEAPGLSEEQRVRLRRVSWSAFQDLERAGMGISFGSQSEGAPARIGSTIDGFDSINVLQPNDIIVEFDGRPIATSRDLRLAILSRRPGERVGLGILRGGRLVESPIELGAFGDLGNARALDVVDLRDAWLFRCGDSDVGEDEAIGPGLEPQAWLDESGAQIAGADFAGRGAMDHGTFAAKAAGETVRMGTQEDLTGLRQMRDQLHRRLAMRRENIRAMRSNLANIADDPRRMREAERNIGLIEEQMRDLLRQIRELDQQIEMRGGR